MKYEGDLYAKVYGKYIPISHTQEFDTLEKVIGDIIATDNPEHGCRRCTKRPCGSFAGCEFQFKGADTQD